MGGASDGGLLEDSQGVCSQGRDLEELPFAIHSFPQDIEKLEVDIEEIPDLILLNIMNKKDNLYKFVMDRCF